jgi:hypothetical protein
VTGIGIHVGTNTVRFAMVEGSDIIRASEKKLTPEVTVWHILKDLRNELGNKGVFTVPAPGLFGRLIRFEKEEDLPILLEENLPQEGELFKFSAQKLGNEAFVAGAFKGDLLGYYGVIKRAGFEPLALDLTIFSSLRTLLANYPEQRVRDFVLLHRDKDLVSLLFVVGGRPALTLSYQGNNGEEDRLFLILTELSEILIKGHYDLLISGEVTDKIYLYKRVAEELEVDVEVVNPFRRLKIETEVEDPSLFVASIGAALRASNYA